MKFKYVVFLLLFSLCFNFLFAQDNNSKKNGVDSTNQNEPYYNSKDSVESYEIKISRVAKGNRVLIKDYIFNSNLPKTRGIAVIIKVNTDGVGVFDSFDRGVNSTKTLPYSEAIKNYLTIMRFNKSKYESIVTIIFDFVPAF